ncbi:uncharacterized protein DS421_18g622800 [Arachis hypogaea]|nr:uncharacterized protein DS421_18g622800 [Arachis hypogaea]
MEDEDQLVDVKEEVEEQDEEVSVSSEFSVKKEEVVEEFKPERAYPPKPLEMTREHGNSQPPQTSLNQRFSTLESVIERYEKEMKKSWEDQQSSSMKVLLRQMLSVKEEVKEQESEEDNHESSYSSEAENYIDEGLMEQPIQKAFNEENTPTIIQPPSIDIQEVKATIKSTNPTPNLASKLNQAINKRKLAEERPRQGTIAESSAP